MKNGIKVLLFLTLLYIPIFTKALTTYEGGIPKANQYASKFKNYHDYLVTSNMPYDFADGEIINSLRFKKGGFLSKDEFEITNVHGSSYLATGLEYWTLSQHSNNQNYVIGYMLTSKELTDKTDVRVTNYVKNETKVAGSGTKNNPWYFIEVLTVNVQSTNKNRGTLSHVPCDSLEDGEESIVVQKYGNIESKFYACVHNDFEYHKTTCKIYLEENDNEFTIKNNIIDNTICKIDFKHKTHAKTLQKCEGCSPNTSPTTLYLAQNKDMFFRDEGITEIKKLDSIPKKKGYTFKGYYKDEGLNQPIIDEDGNIKSTQMSESESTLYLKMKAHDYTISYNCNGGTGSTPSSNHTVDVSKKLNAVQCKKNGSIFKGWSDSSTSTTVKYNDQASVKNLSFDEGGEKILFAVWESCGAGTYNNDGDFDCDSCTSGTYSDAGATNCTTCPPGYTSDPLAAGINKCYIIVPDGKYIATENTATPTNCPIGQFKTSHKVYYGKTSSCDACDSCYTNTEGSSSCPTLKKYTITYDANGGTGAPSSQTKYCGTNLTLTTSKPSKTGYTFNGWKASNGTTYTSGGTYTANASTTLTAQWKSDRVYLVKNGQDQTSLTGGWKGYSHYLAGYFGESPDIDYGSNRIKLTNDNWMNVSGTVYTKNKINFSGFTKLVFDGEVDEGTMNMGGSFKVKTSAGSSWDDNIVKNHEFTEYETGNKTQDYTMDISSLNGSYVVGFGLFGNNAASQNYIRIFNLYLE